jgi:hypothetical protein
MKAGRLLPVDSRPVGRLWAMADDLIAQSGRLRDWVNPPLSVSDAGTSCQRPPRTADSSSIASGRRGCRTKPLEQDLLSPLTALSATASTAISFDAFAAATTASSVFATPASQTPEVATPECPPIGRRVWHASPSGVESPLIDLDRGAYTDARIALP